MIIGHENEVVEFKLTTSEKKEAAESIVAILNKHCKGTLYFGIDDNGYIIGQQISDSTKRDISRTINELIEPRINPSIQEININEKTIIMVSFSGYNRPYSCQGKYLSRCGTENRKMTTDELKTLIMHIDYSSKWEEELTSYTIDDLDDDSIYDFYISAMNCGRIDNFKYNKCKILSNLGLVKDGYVNNGCYALFGRNTKIGLKLAKYSTNDKVTFLDLKLINGNIYNLISKAVTYILDNINWGIEIGKRKRKDIPEIPENAIREIVVNAFAHTDYETLPEIEIGIHPSKIEIYNQGSFPFDLTPYDFINKNMPSYKRNKLILDILFRSKDVEKSGTGFQRVNNLCNKFGILWTYRKEANGFFFEFVRPNVQENVQENVHENVHENIVLTNTEKIIYDLIVNKKGISKKELALKIGKTEKTIQRIINSLINKNMIIRIGSDKKGYWDAPK